MVLAGQPCQGRDPGSPTGPPTSGCPGTEEDDHANSNHANHPQHHEHTMVTKSPQAEHPALAAYLAAPH
ncbi:hypothetical protein GA0115236_161625 [Streptomyces sp. IgraMP-1]|nr:hypothetical protein GA0115236_161625 [Streptomyces sp. IgraMP-1]